MRMLAKLGLSLGLVAGLAAAAAAAEVTLEGKVMCAKCTLQKADATSCQDVLVVEGDADPVEYYIVKNQVSEAFGHVCRGKKRAIVKGTVEQRDGKNWLTPTKMDSNG